MLGDFDRAVEQLFVSVISPLDLIQRPQVPLGVGVQPRPGLGECALLANAGQHILQLPPLGDVVMHMVGRDQRNAQFARQRVELCQPHVVRQVVGERGGEEEPPWKGGREARRHGGTEARRGRQRRA
ncbi:MAG: hypothetical protein ACKVS9_05115, partial [Phycisphaerae bacterium]